jgi:hypothetical protein
MNKKVHILLKSSSQVMKHQHHMQAVEKLLIIVLLCFIANACLAQPKRFFTEAAIRFTGDAELAFVGPSVGVGTGLRFGEYVAISTNYTFFHAAYTSNGQRSTFTTHTLDVMAAYQFKEIFNPARGLYLGTGVGCQFRRNTPAIEALKKPVYLVAILNVGYRFPITLNKKPYQLAIELKGMGPYQEKHSEGQYLELLTQTMAGVSLRF